VGSWLAGYLNTGDRRDEMTTFVAVITINALIGFGIAIKDESWFSMVINLAIAGWGIYLLVGAK
jgi:hypothetical protein